MKNKPDGLFFNRQFCAEAQNCCDRRGARGLSVERFGMEEKMNHINDAENISQKQYQEAFPYILDIHTHSLASGHAYGTIREMAQAASEKGLSLLGIADHAPGTPGTCDPAYFLNLHAVPEILSGVRVIHGSEINVRNDGTLSLGQRYIDRLDYAIVGIHGDCYEDAGREQNTRNLIACMKNEKVHFVSHPDDDHTPLDYEMLVRAAKEYQVALEVNNSSFYKQDRRLNCVQNYRTMLALCEKLRVPVIVSSDAHDPSAVGNFEEAEKLLKEIDFDETLVLNTSVEKLLLHIGMSKDVVQVCPKMWGLDRTKKKN